MKQFQTKEPYKTQSNHYASKPRTQMMKEKIKRRIYDEISNKSYYKSKNIKTKSKNDRQLIPTT